MFDGHGGTAAAEWLQRYLHEHLGLANGTHLRTPSRHLLDINTKPKELQEEVQGARGQAGKAGFGIGGFR